jgi:hypothetical protein
MTQLAWVVDDIEAAEAEFRDVHGVSTWTRLSNVEFGPDDCTYRGKPADFVAHVGLSYLGDLQLELIQPVRGESIYTEFLASRGSGLHHGCWETDDIEATLANLNVPPVVQAGSMAGGEIRFAYVEPGLPNLPYVELAQVSPGMRSFFDDLKKQCAAA